LRSCAAASALLVHVWDGHAEAQLDPFLVLVLLMLYEDWSLIALAVMFVLGGHLVRDQAWEPGATHTLFVALVAIAGMAGGRLNANLRDDARAATQRFRSSFDSAPIGMAVLSREGRFIDVNESLSQIVGYDRCALVGLSLQELTFEEDRDNDAHLVRQMLAGDRRTSQRLKRFLHADGHTIWVNLSLSFVLGGNGTPGHFIAQIEDVTERKRTLDELQHLADHDALTGLLNRRRLEQAIEQQIELVERYERPSCLVLLDLDDFKSTNDSLGHAVGDELLRNVAELLRGRVRRSDLVARLGGDEFAILLAHAGREQARRVAEGIARAIRDRVHITAGHEVWATASFGIATIEANDSASRVLLRADQAMYRVKDGGRDGIAIAASPLRGERGDAT
jgi:diguanylate cyclase (GGDEF)-like protein/PAS domain S-box-containing protein